MIKQAIQNAEAIKLDAEIYTCLLAAKAEHSDRVEKDIAELSSQVGNLVENFLREKGYL